MLSFNICSFKEFYGINRLFTVHTSMFTLFPHLQFHDTISRRCKAIFLYTFCIFFILPFVLIITFERFVALIFALLQLSGELYTNFINSPLFLKECINNIDQLIEYLFNHWLPKLVLLDLGKVFEQRAIGIYSSRVV